jgi:hypothetical protein
MTGNLNMGTKKVTNMADGTLSTDGATYGQLTTTNTTATTNFNTLVQSIPYLSNPVVNSDFQIAQRATTYALTTTPAFGSVDRWFSWQATSAAGIFNQNAETLGNGRSYSAKLGRNNGSTGTGTITMGQAIESSRCARFVSKTIILSWYAKAGANFSASSSNLNVKLATGTGTDQSSATLANGTWTGYATPINYTTAITTSWVRYSQSITLPSSVTQLGILISYTPSGTAGADDNVYIADVMIEEAYNSNTTPTLYRRLHYADSLRECMRHYQIFTTTVSNFASVGLSIVGQSLNFAEPMRVAPSPTQLTNNVDLVQTNVSSSTSTFIMRATGGYIFRTATGAGAGAQFSETDSYLADL